MGIKCQIFRDTNNDIEQVVAQNGRPSKLYQDLVLETKDNELALKLWALYNTEEFLNFATNESGLRIDYDANGEPLVEDLISFVKTQVPTLNTTDYLNLSKNLISLGNIDFSEFVNRLGSTFYNTKGVFTISKNRLETSKLYNKAEIENILTDKVLQKNVKSFVDKIMFRSTTDTKLSNINESLTGDSKPVRGNRSKMNPIDDYIGEVIEFGSITKDSYIKGAFDSMMSATDRKYSEFMTDEEMENSERLLPTIESITKDVANLAYQRGFYGGF